ncbi:glutathione peroxidase [Hwanghaeella grinnelliae]|uniref:Glutathione peroxidase n=1 Tax=Hwanghaeella grinnelliae TaxID=2500179 RepID=A0A3S2VRI4_9PROT|nr:glutathione peroxidase [Hwanghaeella grinnelliae]RVU38763.1 glutathione peroxidase [Hwanghaeella grinnelliae]
MTKLHTLFFALAVAALAALSLTNTASVASAADPNAHKYDFVSIEGDAMPMNDYAGKAVLVVNTASFCGYTGQYKALQAVYEKYRDRGLVVLGVPSNDFGSQEPGTATEIKEFCETTYDITFPMTEKQVVRGDAAHPFYKWAREALGAEGTPRWNFHKILIGPDGSALAGWPSVTKPDSEAIISAIESALNAPSG